jgi:ABC-type glycerol-3-phosphate transport system permease component
VSHALLAFVGASILGAAAFGAVLEVQKALYSHESAPDVHNRITDYEPAFAALGIVAAVFLFFFYFLQRKLTRGPRNVRIGRN